MRVRLNTDMRAVPEGEVYPRLFRAGEIVTGNVAAAALSLKAGEIVGPEAEIKGGRRGGGRKAQAAAPENKQAGAPQQDAANAPDGETSNEPGGDAANETPPPTDGEAGGALL